MCVAVYARSRMPDAVVATNMDGTKGCFSLALDNNGRLTAMARTREGKLVECSSRSVVPLEVWHHIVVTLDGDQMRLFENGELTGKQACQEMAPGKQDTIWIGTNATATALWDGRIDELSLFDRALRTKSITDLYQVAREQVAREQVAGSDEQPAMEQ